MDTDGGCSAGPLAQAASGVAGTSIKIANNGNDLSQGQFISAHIFHGFAIT